MSVQRSQSSIQRGQKATYVVQVSTKNGPASDVSVALTSQPASQKPQFAGGCAKGDGTASCTVGTVSVKAPAVLHAQIAVASSATAVSSVKLTATASIVTTVKWTPPTADQTTAVTSAAAPRAHPSPAASPRPTPLHAAPLGPIPSLNGAASALIGTGHESRSLISAGNASGLFPSITPSATPSPHPHSAVPQPTRRHVNPGSSSLARASGTPVLTAQVAGLIALGLAVMLTVAGLSMRRRSGGQRG